MTDFLFLQAHRRTGPNRPRQVRNPADVGTTQAQPASTWRGPSTQVCPESSQLSEPAWWLHAHFGRRPFPWKQFIQAVSAGGQATRPCQSIPEGGGKRDSMVPKSGNTIRQIGPSELQPGRKGTLVRACPIKDTCHESPHEYPPENQGDPAKGLSQARSARRNAVLVANSSKSRSPD